MYNPEEEGSTDLLLDWVRQRITKEINAHPNSSYRVYFNLEFDSNQTTYERKSNLLDIGVLAPTDELGRAMSSLLRVLIDDNIDYLACVADEESVSYEDYFKLLCNDENEM